MDRPSLNLIFIPSLNMPNPQHARAGLGWLAAYDGAAAVASSQILEASTPTFSPDDLDAILSEVEQDRQPYIQLPEHASFAEAAQIAVAINATEITILSSHHGLYAGDPILVPETTVLGKVSYQEAAEIDFQGARHFHPSDLLPLQQAGIPLWIRPIDDPQAAGTCIGPNTQQSEFAKAVTAIGGKTLLVVEGSGMAGLPGFSARAVSAIANEGISIVMLSQASTEQSIGLVIEQSDRHVALSALRATFEEDLQTGAVARIYVIDEVGIVTVVDEGMRYRAGLTGRMFNTLGRSGINVITLAEGASETNISAVVDAIDLKRSAQALHESFVLGQNRVNVFLFGAGTVGQRLLSLLEVHAPDLRSSMRVNLQLVGLANTRHMVWDQDGLQPANAAERLSLSQDPLDIEAIIGHLINSRLERLLVIDATASDEIADLYPRLLQNGIGVITPNKRGNTQSMDFYRLLQDAARAQQVPYLYETTVGAGLPVISTLQELLLSGDRLIKIEGILSGTLGFIFNSMHAGRSFAEAVLEAKAKGYSEPDPRDDLRGEDVARKVMILAREAGFVVERESVSVESLVPPEYAKGTAEEFLTNLEAIGAPWDERIAAANAAGTRLCYIGHVEKDRLEVGVQEVADHSPFASTQGTDNLIVFTTQRYKTQPLVIKGPGAGPEVTAGGVLGDVIKASRRVA